MHTIASLFLAMSLSVALAPPAAAQMNMLNDTVVHGDTAKVPHPTKDDPYAFAPVDVEPKPKDDFRAHLVYPPEAKRRGIEGRVDLRFKILENGRVGKIVVERSTHQLLNRAAVEAIKRTTFTPAVKGGKPVAVWTSLSVDFRMR